MLAVESIAIDSEGRLLVRPHISKPKDYSLIWRDASGIRWDNTEKAFVAYEPTRWEHLPLLKQIVQAAFNEYGELLFVTEDTQWRDVPPDLREQIEEHLRSEAIKKGNK